MIRYRSLALTAVLASLALIQTTICAAQPSAITDSEEAESRARSLLGLSTSFRATGTAVRSQVVDSTTASLASQISSRAAWVITWENVHFDLAGVTEEYALEHPRDITIYLDAETGNPLRVVSTVKGFRESPKNKSAAAAEGLALGFESYVGLPSEMPSISFKEALDTVSFCSNPLSAQEVIGIFVMLKRFIRSDQYSVVPVWEIYEYGGPTPYGAMHPELPHEKTSFWRTTIDARTGAFLGACNRPFLPAGGASDGSTEMKPPVLPPDSLLPNATQPR